MTQQRELTFQKLIIGSYARQLGYARKWASDHTAGQPDLVCSMPGVGIHLVEVKHAPQFGDTVVDMANPMTALQQLTARKYIEAGGRVVLAVVGKSSGAIGSALYLYNPLLPRINTAKTCHSVYRPGTGFDVKWLLSHHRFETSNGTP